jgi:DNA-binding LytR/AlgR family response regulator
MHMIKTVIIEDERLIAEEFTKMLMRASAKVEIVGSFSTVKESIDFLSANEAPDLIFSDVQLPDGLSFDIFNKVHVKSPVVYVTAYDNYILNAFESNGIDYLLKPVDQKDIEKTLEKYKTLKDHFDNHRSFINSFYKKQKTRLLVRKGIENIILRTSDIVIIYTENKLVYVIDKDGKKYIADKNLSDLDGELDPGVFFRVNRQYIINIGFVKGYKAYEKVKLQIDLTMPELQHQIIVSQEMAPCFRKWISGL